ncbi:MAG: 1-deoxy-D-xylulose-5-phosphate reductoisomerase, partial [Candidatus Binatia bacterium]
VAGRNLERLAEQILEFSPEWVSIGKKEDIPRLQTLLRKQKPEILWGEEGAKTIAAAPEVDMVIAAIVGGAGLVPTLAAVQAGKEVGLANKEALVMAGEIFIREARQRGARLLPVDSEHSAIFQCLQGHRKEDVDRIILTASGGPFLRTTLKTLNRVTVKQALKHPNWKMGPKITIDSATMMNKGLEVVEARWLFDTEPSRIEVVIHPESIVHSMVRYQDGTIIAQLGIPDMQIPIAYALSYPNRLKMNLPSLELTQKGKLNFLPVEKKRFPALNMAYEALAVGGSMPAVLNAANEVAVGAFLDKRIGFRDIHRLIEKTTGAHAWTRPKDLADILEVDRWARAHATAFVNNGLKEKRK